MITTGVSDDSDAATNKKNCAIPDNNQTNIEQISSSSNSTSGAAGMRIASRCRQGGRSGMSHGDRRYHTTGVIEDIKVCFVFHGM